MGHSHSKNKHKDILANPVVYQQPQQQVQQQYQGLAPPVQQQQLPQYQGLAPPQAQQVLQDPFLFFFQKYQISPYYRNDLMTLGQFDIVLVLDDSGSMSTATENGTRWSELKGMATPIVELGSLLDSDGIDVIFLNRGTRRNVRSINDIQDLLVNPPQYRTPLSNKVREAMSLAKGKPQLILIMTDGEPYTVDDQRDPNFDSVHVFRRVLEVERNSDLAYVSILKCSNNDDDTGYLDVMDKQLRNLDVIDDYVSERNEVLRKQGPNFQYTPGDNIARFLLGSIFPRYDNMDERFLE